MPAKAPPRDDPDPSACVLAAYRAANAGQYAKADVFLDPAMVRALERVNAATLAASRRLRRLLSGLDGRQDPLAIRTRGTLGVLLESLDAITTPQPGSPRHRRQLWDQATRGRSLADIEATHEFVDGSYALVRLKLTLKDGSVIRDTEPVVRQQGRWLLG